MKFYTNSIDVFVNVFVFFSFFYVFIFTEDNQYSYLLSLLLQITMKHETRAINRAIL